MRDLLWALLTTLAAVIVAAAAIIYANELGVWTRVFWGSAPLFALTALALIGHYWWFRDRPKTKNPVKREAAHPAAINPVRDVGLGEAMAFVCFKVWGKHFMWRQRERDVIPVVTNRDLRRTWKTLAGKAGVSKEIRDRLQNHTLQDVSSKSYDRWNYMPEKRDGMNTWDRFVTALFRKKHVRIAA